MAEFDVVLKGGTLVDGTRLPRYQADIGIKDGIVAKIGKISASSATNVLDAGGQIVAPGIVDCHTHLDGQIFWDPYCTTAGWHGVTSVVLGNCGFGFAPVAPELRDRAMLMMSRNEQIPFASLKAGMPWDWVTYPEFLDSLDRTPKGVNCISYVPISPLMVWVMGLEEAKSGREPTDVETKEMQRLLDEALTAGGAGWSAQRSGAKSMQADYDGTPFPTDVMSDELCYAFAEVLGRFDFGAIQHSPLINPGEYATLDAMLEAALKMGPEVSERLAEISGRPVIHNLITPTPGAPQILDSMLKWLEDAHARGNRVIGQGATVRAKLKFSLELNQTFDASDVWRSVFQGSKEEQLHRLRDPEIRAKMIADQGAAGFVLQGNFADLVLCRVGNRPHLKDLLGNTLGELSAKLGKPPVEIMLDLSDETSFDAEFETGDLVSDVDGVAKLMASPHIVPGPSDGGAHMKMTVGGTFGTDLITWMVREQEKVSLEEAHWHLSYLSAHAAGFRDRGFIREGAPADIFVYDFDNLQIVPKDTYDTAYDLPAGEWRRVQRAEGIRYTMVNGELTFEDGVCTDATPGRLLRQGKG